MEAHRFRFDFNHHKTVTKQEIREIERIINEKIRENQPVHSYELSYEEAQTKKELKQFFGEKYGSTVRVIDIDYSKELCGGTHTHQVGTIGLFRITKEGSIASGVRRIEGVTGVEAEDFLYEEEEILDRCSAKLKTTPSLLEEKLSALIEENKAQLEKLKLLKKHEIASLAKTLKNDALKIHNVLFIATIVPLSQEELPVLAEELSHKEGSFVYALAMQDHERCQILVKVSPDLQKKGILAGSLIQKMAPLIDGKGGGKADSAQAGGKNPNGIFSAFDIVKGLLESLC